MESSSVEGIKEEMENGGPRSSSLTETGREGVGVCHRKARGRRTPMAFLITPDPQRAAHGWGGPGFLPPFL